MPGLLAARQAVETSLAALDHERRQLQSLSDQLDRDLLVAHRAGMLPRELAALIGETVFRTMARIDQARHEEST